MMNLSDWIKNHEGLKLKLYKDTVNKWTIGYGRNIEDLGITQSEAEFMFQNDLNRCIDQLKAYDWYNNQPTNIQYALTNMCFNIGINRLLGFKRMLKAIQDKNYTLAAMEALNSKWARQVGKRAKDIATLIREGLGNDLTA